MKNAHQLLLPLLVPPLCALAQETKDVPPPAAPIELQSLQSIVVDTVHRRQPTAAAEATAHDTAFARIRDAEFASDGRLAAFLVAPPPDAKVPAGTLRRLPANAVRWDQPTRRWLLSSATQQFEELATHEPAKDTDGAKLPAIATPTSRLASELLRSEPDDPAAELPAKALDETRPTTAPRIVWWFAPTAQQLAVAVVPAVGKHVVVPWSALRLHGEPTAPKVRVEPPTNLAKAPSCEHGDTMPAQALRQRSYEHFGVPTPTWDRQAAGTGNASQPARPGKGKEAGQG